MRYFIWCIVIQLMMSCQAQNTSSLKVISATKTTWYGGVEGVKGENINIVIETSKSSEIRFKYMVINHKKWDLESKTTIKGNNKLISLRLNYQYPNQNMPSISMEGDKVSENNEDSAPVKKGVLYYEDLSTGKIRQLLIDHIKQEQNEEFYP